MHDQVGGYFDLAKICGNRDRCHHFNGVAWMAIKKWMESERKY